MELDSYRISDPAQVESIVRRFMAMPLHEIKQHQTVAAPTAKCLTETIIMTEYLDEDKAQNMDFMDIFCLIEHISDNPDYAYIRDDKSTCTSQMIKILHYRLLMVYLRNAYASSIPVKLFLTLTVKSFYEFLGSVSCTKEINDEYDFVKDCIRSVMKDFDEDTSTIKQVLDALSNTLQKAWSPTAMQITSYESMILEASALIGRFLIGSFKIAFKNRFNAKSVIEKYESDYPYID